PTTQPATSPKSCSASRSRSYSIMTRRKICCAPACRSSRPSTRKCTTKHAGLFRRTQMNRIALREIAAAWLCCGAIAAAGLVFVPTGRQSDPGAIIRAAPQLALANSVQAHRRGSPDSFEDEADRAAAVAGLVDEAAGPAPVVAQAQNKPREICA